MSEHREWLFLERHETLKRLSGKPTCEPYLSLLQRILSFLSTNSILTGVAAASVLYVSFLLQNVFSTLLLMSCFFLTVSVYNINKLTDLSEDLINAPESVSFVKRNHKAIMLGAVGAYGVALVCAYLCNLYEVGVALIPLCFGLLYSVRLFNVRLKDVPVMKNAVIAGTFACMAVLMPLALHFGGSNPLAIHFSTFTVVALLLAYFFFFKIFINTVLFDVRDMHGDQLAGIVTIPGLLGRMKTKGVLLALNSTLIPWLLLAAWEGLFIKTIIVLGAGVIYGYWYILHFCKEGVVARKPLNLLVDGEWVLMAIALTLLILTPMNLSTTGYFLSHTYQFVHNWVLHVSTGLHPHQISMPTFHQQPNPLTLSKGVSRPLLLTS
jgi:4-hydroxybenzoate polyprenyltransferase